MGHPVVGCPCPARGAALPRSVPAQKYCSPSPQTPGFQESHFFPFMPQDMTDPCAEPPQLLPAAPVVLAMGLHLHVLRSLHSAVLACPGETRSEPREEGASGRWRARLVCPGWFPSRYLGLYAPPSLPSTLPPPPPPPAQPPRPVPHQSTQVGAGGQQVAGLTRAESRWGGLRLLVCCFIKAASPPPPAPSSHAGQTGKLLALAVKGQSICQEILS